MLGMLGFSRAPLYMLALRSLGEERNGAKSSTDSASQTRRRPPSQGLDRAGAVAADTNELRLALHALTCPLPGARAADAGLASARQDHVIGQQQGIGIANI